MDKKEISKFADMLGEFISLYMDDYNGEITLNEIQKRIIDKLEE